MMDEPPHRARQIWVVTDGRAGNENPARGLAEAVAERLPGAEISVKRLQLRRWAVGLPARAWSWFGARPGGWPFSALTDGAALSPPYPDLVIGAGRRAGPIVAALRRLGGGRLRAVQLMDPQMPTSAFDLVAAPAHDELRGPNVIGVTGSLHRIGDAELATLDPRLDGLRRPLFSVLVGGPSASAGFSQADGERLLDALTLLAARGAGVAVTASRRTPDWLRRRLEAQINGAGGWMWRGDPPNPYFALLGQADAIIVTADSVNMASEACAAGKPVYIAPLDRLKPKFRRFHARLAAGGHARALPLAADPSALLGWRPAPIDDCDRIADRVAALLL